MTNIKPVKQIYDNVFGFVDVSDLELQIVDHKLFQRLRRIKQLGMLHYVFPGAEHTRFAHSLGVLYVADRMASKLEELGYLTHQDHLKLRIAALLHDIGHYPLSHTIEELMREQDDEQGRHERSSIRLIHESSLKDVIGQNYSAEEIGKIILGKHTNALYTQIVNSELDADRIDYLLRDSLHTGVRFGRIEWEQLIRTLDLDNQKRLALKPKGRHAAESYVLARYHMYAQIYSHKVSGGFDKLMQLAYRILVEMGRLPSFDQIKELPEDEFAMYDDHELLHEIRRGCLEGKGDLSRACDMILRREKLITVKEARELIGPQVSGSKSFTDTRRGLELLERNRSSDLSKDADRMTFVDRPDVRLSELKPFVEITEVYPREDEMIAAIKVLDKDGSSKPLVSDPASVLSHVGNLSLQIIRLYTTNSHLEEVSKALQRYGVEPDNAVAQ